MECPLLHRARMAAWGTWLGLFLVLAGCGRGETGRDGAEIYAKRCSSCHGDVGVGDGPTATLMGIEPANLQIAVREKSKAELLGTIARGRRAMPAFGQSLTAGEREAVYQYLRTLPKKKAGVSRGLDPTGAQGLR